MHIDDIIFCNGTYYKYSNIVKNSTIIDPWGDFIIKTYKPDGKPTNSYVYMAKEIFRYPEIINYTKTFNPEKLI